MSEYLFAELRRQLEAVQVQTGRDPKRIFLTDQIPEGIMFRVPCEEDGSSLRLFSDRTLDDGGPFEVLMHPEDLQRMMNSAWEQNLKPRYRAKGYTHQKIRALKKKAMKTTLANSEDLSILGIPIVNTELLNDQWIN